LERGQVSPEGALWANIGPCLGGGWAMDGNLPEAPGLITPWGEYRHSWEAAEAAIAYAHRVKVAVLYIEIDARRC
jgi:hypothetical protein